MGELFLKRKEKHKNMNRNRKRSSFIAQESVSAYIMILPFMLGLSLFFLLPSLASFFLAFTEWDGLSVPIFKGIQNFALMLEDEIFKRALINTFIFTFLAVPLSVILAIAFATLLNQKIRGITIYRTLFFIPYVTMPVAVGLIWKWLYNSEYGLFNYILSLFNIPPVDWLFNENIALVSIVIAYVWMTVGNNTVILLAGLQGISPTFYEAAEIDGANTLKKFFYITLPLLTPGIFFVIVMSMISSLQVFDIVYAMMGENLALLDPTRTIVYSIYEQGFKYFNMGYASAQGFLLFILILFLTIIQMYFQRKWVNY